MLSTRKLKTKCCLSKLTLNKINTSVLLGQHKQATTRPFRTLMARKGQQHKQSHIGFKPNKY